MAMQAGMGVSKIVLIAGAGYTGTILMRNGKLSDILSELQTIINSGPSETDSDPSEKLQRLLQELRRSLNERQITVYSDSSQSNLGSLAVPAAALGALGYGYMRWKGISFSDLMYVTKRSMAVAVESLTKNLENVSEAVAATKKHLTQRMENLDAKLDEQAEVSKLILNEVGYVRDDLSGLSYNLDSIQGLVSGLGDRMGQLEYKQDMGNAGIGFLCNFVAGGGVPTAPDAKEKFQQIQENLMISAAAAAKIEDPNYLMTDGTAQGGSDKLNTTSFRGPNFQGLNSLLTDGTAKDGYDKLRRPITRTVSALVKC